MMTEVERKQQENGKEDSGMERLAKVKRCPFCYCQRQVEKLAGGFFK